MSAMSRPFPIHCSMRRRTSPPRYVRYIYTTKIPSDFLSRGGILIVVAAEIPVALNDRLGVIASKDGYVDANFKSALRDDSAFVNLSIGLKYALLNDPATDSIFTIGAE